MSFARPQSDGRSTPSLVACGRRSPISSVRAATRFAMSRAWVRLRCSIRRCPRRRSRPSQEPASRRERSTAEATIRATTSPSSSWPFSPRSRGPGSSLLPLAAHPAVRRRQRIDVRLAHSSHGFPDRADFNRHRCGRLLRVRADRSRSRRPVPLRRAGHPATGLDIVRYDLSNETPIVLSSAPEALAMVLDTERQLVR